MERKLNEQIKEELELADRNISKIINPNNKHNRIAKEISKMLKDLSNA